MAENKRYWSGLDELNKTEAYKEALAVEFQGQQSVDEFLGDERLKETNTGRRDFLKFMGFSITAATLAACETPVVKSIPYVNKPEEITPGIANYYASTYFDGQDFGSILVKTREGRPIFIKGNKEFGFGGGVLNARINSSVLGLYDSARIQSPMIGKTASDWNTVDEKIMAALSAAKRVAIVSGSVISPSTSRAINEFKARYNADHVQYEAISYQGMRDANQNAFGKAAVPMYHFDKAKVIVSIAADFLSTWLTGNVYAADYAKGRRPEGAWMSKHFQFESAMSVTGTNADARYMISPSQEGKVAAAILDRLNGGNAGVEGVEEGALAKAVAALKANRGNALVVAGSNDVNVQMIVNAINMSLDSYGNTIDIKNPLRAFAGDDRAFAKLVSDMKSGAVDAVIFYGTNPVYSYHNAADLRDAMSKVATKVSFNLVADETASLCDYCCPDNHYLESWNDLSIVNGRVDLVQPAITPLFSTRQAQTSLLKWSGNDSDYYTYLRQTHNAGYNADMMNTDQSWNAAVHNGCMMTAAVADAPIEMVAEESAPSLDVAGAIAAVTAIKGGTFELSTYLKAGIGNGSQASNPWLQELPDPVTKVTWDNYVTMAQSDMESMNLNTYIAQRDHASLVKVTANGMDVILPAYPQPGQKPGTVGIALGYGRGAGNENIGRAAFQTKENGEHIVGEDGLFVPIGKNVFPMATVQNGTPVYANYSVDVVAAEGTYPLACTQMHHTYMGRDSVVKETSYSAFKAEADKPKGKASWNMAHGLAVHEDVNGDGVINAQDKKPISDFDLWHEHPVEGVGHRWGMTIDLSSCIGCGSCITACHIENNVPVVGKDEVLRHRDMHWMRIDRFYSSDYSLERGEEEGLGAIDTYGRMEHPSANPQTVHMPMMCQHCNHAPCETVCPVLATTHSNEGLNQMTYNRCIGTRYCANNCPYKVRRFNWFNYMGYDKFKNFNPSQDSLSRMVLNPDVTVRARGVMEKCSMCVQRIQTGKLDAKKAGTPVADGAVVSACSEACPTHAITFGDLNDNKSNVRGISQNNRAYHALEEVGVQPNIYYMAKVRNTEDQEA